MAIITLSLFCLIFSPENMKKVLIITYYWPPSGGAGVQRWLKFCKYLPEFGIEPIVLTVDAEYASYAQIDESLKAEVSKDLSVYKTKSFELYRLYSKLSRKRKYLMAVLPMKPSLDYFKSSVALPEETSFYQTLEKDGINMLPDKQKRLFRKTKLKL